VAVKSIFVPRRDVDGGILSDGWQRVIGSLISLRADKGGGKEEVGAREYEGLDMNLSRKRAGSSWKILFESEEEQSLTRPKMCLEINVYSRRPRELKSQSQSDHPPHTKNPFFLALINCEYECY
jgi:hypothetical protein